MDLNRNDSSHNGPNKSGNDKRKPNLWLALVVAVLAVLLIGSIYNMINKSQYTETTWSHFRAAMAKGDIVEAEIQYDRVIYLTKEQAALPAAQQKACYTGLPSSYNQIELADALIAQGATVNKPIVEDNSTIMMILYYLGMGLLIFGMMNMVTRRMSGDGMMGGLGKSKAKMYMEKSTGVTFKDVAGQDEAKESLQEIIDFLHNPQKYTEIGAKLPKGALLVGSPGTGKTLLAKAVAGEAEVPFFSISGSDFVEMFVGMGASRVRDLFKEAAKVAPCIIFIDEIDAVGRARDARFGGGNSEHEQTLNQLLNEIDGFEPTKGIVCLAATNRPEILDKALLRPGRFDRRIIVDRPNLQGRLDTLKVHTRKIRLAEDVDLRKIAQATAGAVGADLANLVNEAGEAEVPFFSISGSDFVEMFVGMGASRVRDLFKEAAKVAPCIIFIDEIDAVGRARDARFGGGNSEHEQTLNQLLNEIDGFEPTKGIVCLAATNRPEILDKALLRPGRFDRRIIVDRPNLQGRLDTLKVHTRKIRLAEDVDLRKIAQATAGAVGADLANLVNEAALRAVRQGRKAVNQEDLMVSFETVIAGTEKKNTVLTDMEKRLVAYHEVGHALVSALLKRTDPVTKITIVPHTTGALGYTLYTPEEEKFLSTNEELHANLCGMLGGRAAEQVVFGVKTTGASNDIQRATSLARNMVALYGMSDELGLMAPATVSNQYLDGQSYLDCSQETSAKVDQAVKDLLDRSYNEAKKLLTDNRALLDEISEYLLVKETITGEELMAYVNADKKSSESEQTPEE